MLVSGRLQKKGKEKLQKMGENLTKTGHMEIGSN